MAVDPADLEAIKQAIIGAIDAAAGTSANLSGNAKAIADLDKYIIKLNEAGDALDRQKQIAEAKADSDKKLNELAQIDIDMYKNKIEIAQALLREKKLENQLTQEMEESTKKYIAKQVEEIENLEKEIENRKEAAKATAEMTAAMESLSDTMGGMVTVYGKHNTLNVANIKNMAETIRKAGLFGAAFGAVKGVFVGLIDTMIELSFQVDKAESNFMAVTGATRAMAQSISEDRAAAQRLGISVDELFASHQALRQEMTIFSGLQPEVQKQLGMTGAALEKQGVSMSDFAKVTEMGMKAFGMGAIQASEASIQLNQLARDIGVTPQQMSKDFAGAAGELAAFGDAGVGAFKDLAIASKKSGLEIDKLLRISEGFDTFEGAATSAGKLNAALGGNFVNAMDLMMAKEPAKRFEMIRDAVMQTGKTFDDMEYFEKKFYVNAIDGIDSVADLALLMSDNFQDLSKDTNMQAADFEALAKQTKDIQSVMDSLKNLFATQLVPILSKDVIPAIREAIKQFDQGKGPIVEIVKVVRIFANAAVFLADNLKLVGAAITLYMGRGLLMGIGKAIMALVAKFGALKVSTAATAATMGTSLAAGIKLVGAAALKSAKGLAIISGVALAVGLAVKMAAEGVGELVAAFGQVGDNAGAAVGGIFAFTAAMALMVGGMVLLAKPAAVAGVGIGILSGAVVALGLGVKLAASGVGEMAEGFGALFASLTTDNTENFTKFVTDMSTKAVDFAIAAQGLVLMSSATDSLASALSAIPMETLEKLSNLGGIGVDVETNGATKNIKAIMDSINEVDTLKLAAASLMVPAAAAGNVAAATTVPTTQAKNQKQPDTNVDVKVYIDGKEMTARAVTAMAKEVGKRSFGH